MSHHPPFKQVEDSRPDYETKNTFHYTKTPQPDWKAGDGLNNANLKHREVYEDPSISGIKTYIPYENISVPDSYKLMINSIVPRPIALCSTLSEDGVPNLAPFSYFNAVGHNPPIIMISSTDLPRQKDTAVNIRKTKEFVVNIISEPFVEAANFTSMDSPAGVSEWKLSGLTPQASLKVKPPRCQEASVSMECELVLMFDHDDPKKLSQTMILGRIKAWNIKEAILVDGGPSISVEKLMPISRLGGISYSRVTTAFELTRPVWEKVKDEPEIKSLLENDGKQ
ncbi:uncharacterized protein MELLADRAFT_53476 [Melampsora larici-populina 98AG31]|uniref:Flavin reductase like domain-containing protein n=1 Tax=Melampsora larici-populina (strain 98AG31 / pathotype 3-4-7) TaxID=747676 RepID=F4S010_MELLP|nr:uncharacterized protein MELLADRAFT_53476 [Melampsora larici-populina 98AG31]EGG01880.1 hypothetical protein MELLADRAFT_53476 [Melampsora larici-populina 98AG31]